MKAAWTVTAYVRSTMPMTDKVASIMSFTYVLFQSEVPRKASVEALVSAHTKNCELLFSEQTFTPFDDDIFSSD